MSHGTSLCYKEHCLVCMPYQNYIAPDLAKDDMIRDVTERIIWTDSGMFLDNGWAALDVYKRQARDWAGEVVTIGRVIYEDDRVVVLGLSEDRTSGNWYGAQLIAKQSILERTSFD